MSRRKKQTPTFLPIFRNKEGKVTFQSFRVEPVETENEKGEKVQSAKIVMNERAKDRYGDEYSKPMNRLSRRIRSKERRLYEKRYGKRVPLSETGDKPFEINAEVADGESNRTKGD